MTRVFLGLGSNTERESHLIAALEALSTLLVDMQCSAVFESEAVNYKGDNFYNLVVSGQTALPVLVLDRLLKTIEADNGRYAPTRKGLPLDIDILLYGEQVGVWEGLVLPRPEVLSNAYVLWPLALLAPDTQHPLTGTCFTELWQAAHLGQRLWPIAFQWRGQALTSQALLTVPKHCC